VCDVDEAENQEFSAGGEHDSQGYLSDDKDGAQPVVSTCIGSSTFLQSSHQIGLRGSHRRNDARIALLLPTALANARALGYACIGGEFLFRLGHGHCR